MKTFKSFMVVTLTTGLISCSPVQFSQPVNQACQSAGSACTTSAGQDNYDYNVSNSSQPVDILFVVDNSASMYSIQQAIGSKFSSLFGLVNKYDYHIGITTTDLANSGQLLAFGDGENFLTRASSNASTLFSGTIARPETLSCQQWIKKNCPASGCVNDDADYAANCPSEDTRAIYASFLTLTTDATGFFRTNAPLSIVIISNSDERAAGGQNGGPALEANDLPSTLVAQAQAMGKSMSVNTLIIEPGDTSCYNQQHFSQTIFGWYAPIYQSLSSSTGGSSSTICASDFSTSLANIGSKVVSQMSSVTLYCAPINGAVTVIENGSTYNLTASSNQVNLPVALSTNQSVEVKYSCSN